MNHCFHPILQIASNVRQECLTYFFTAHIRLHPAKVCVPI